MTAGYQRHRSESDATGIPPTVCSFSEYYLPFGIRNRYTLNCAGPPSRAKVTLDAHVPRTTLPGQARDHRNRRECVGRRAGIRHSTRADRRARAGRVRAGRNRRGYSHSAWLPRVADRGGRTRPRSAHRAVVRLGRAFSIWCQGNGRARLHQRRFARRRLLCLEAVGQSVVRAEGTRCRASPPLQPPPRDS